MKKFKTQISAEVVGDSITAYGHRITSLLVTMPRIVLSELNTHRALSKNSASSRAIPHKKMVEMVKKNLFIPIAWQKAHKGMQGDDYHTGFKVKLFRFLWTFASRMAILFSGLLTRFGATKQLANRLLEPFMYHTVLITGTEWENFFALRCPSYITPVGGKDENGNDWVYRSRKDVINGHSNEFNLEKMDKFTTLDWLKLNTGQAEIHIMEVAECIWDAMNESKPRKLKTGEWHIPFENKLDDFLMTALVMSEDSADIGHHDMISYPLKWVLLAVYISTGMAARTSYTVVGTERAIDYLSLIKIHDKMLLSTPFHASPFEHAAQAAKGGTSGNFKGFKQYRKLLEETGRIKEY